MDARPCLLAAALALLACGGGGSGPEDAGGPPEDARGVDGATRDGSADGAAAPDTGPPSDASRDDAGAAPDAPSPERGIRVDGRRLLRDGAPFVIRGVCWSPVAVGSTLPPDFGAFVAQDAPLMRAAGLNVVRTYEPIRDRAVLDRLHAEGIAVLQMVYSWGGAAPETALDVVRDQKDHPAIVMWVLGNEWNYNGLYVGLGHDEVRDRLQTLAAGIHAEDPSRPVASVYGELPSPETLAAMPDVDVWGLNVYRGLGFGDLFDRWRALSGKPMFLAEYGADAWDARTAEENPAAQAEATRVLTQALLDQHVATNPGGTVLGGTIFEWADEWWKDGSGSPSVHDVGGVAPGGGPHPDATFNEEWWGVVEADRTPRPAYEALRDLYL